MSIKIVDYPPAPLGEPLPKAVYEDVCRMMKDLQAKRPLRFTPKSTDRVYSKVRVTTSGRG